MKYTQEEIRDMAQQYLMADARGDERCDAVIDKLVERTGLTGVQCHTLIIKLSVGVPL